MAEPLIVYRLTRSQQVAILQALTEHWLSEGEVTEVFLDCSQDPPGRIEYADLIRLFTSIPEIQVHHAAPVEVEGERNESNRSEHIA